MRTLDKRFLTLDARQRCKSYFNFVLEEGFRKPLPACGSLLELGCARGDFLHLCSRHLPGIGLTGVDIRQDVLDLAAADFPHIRFRQGDLLSLPGDLGQFDCSCMLAIHSLFDDIEAALLCLLRTVKRGGRALVFGLFNPAELDVLVRIKAARQPKNGFQTGWNIHSKYTVASILEKYAYKFSFTHYPLVEAKTSDDEGHFSSWTQELADGTLQLVNGAQLIHPMALLEILVPA